MSRTESAILDPNGPYRTDVTWENEGGTFRLEQFNEGNPISDRVITMDLSPREAADLVIFLTKYLFEYLE